MDHLWIPILTTNQVTFPGKKWSMIYNLNKVMHEIRALSHLPCLVQTLGFSLWPKQKITGVKPTKQLNLGPIKRGGLSWDQTEAWFDWLQVRKHFFLDSSNFQANYRKLWQAILKNQKKDKQGTSSSAWGEEGSRCLVDVWSVNFKKVSVGKKLSKHSTPL